MHLLNKLSVVTQSARGLWFTSLSRPELLSHSIGWVFNAPVLGLQAAAGWLQHVLRLRRYYQTDESCIAIGNYNRPTVGSDHQAVRVLTGFARDHAIAIRS